MRFDGPFGSIDMRPTPRPEPLWNSRTGEDKRIAAIRALAESAPTHTRGAPKTPEAAILTAIRALLKENR